MPSSGGELSLDEVPLYDPLRVGGFVAVMTTCFKQFKAKEYREIRDKAISHEVDECIRSKLSDGVL
jgi:hypothetical protein